MLPARALPLPPDWHRRLGGLLFVLAMHLLLGLLFLSLAPPVVRNKVAALVTFNVPEFAGAPEQEAAPEPETAETEAEAEATPETPEAQAPPRPVPEAPPPPPEPVPSPEAPPPVAAPAPPAPPPARTYGPPDLRPRGPPDSVRVEGTGPNGEPLYAAAWYREPYDDELAGFLSTARGPGWGLIACRTVPSYRVEDCVIVGESPRGSGIAAAVLAAAWQFQVRPPRVGGRDRYGEWVRIRIDYGLKPDGRAR